PQITPLSLHDALPICDGGGGRRTDGMSPAAGADAGHLAGLRSDVVDDIVRTRGISADSAGKEVEVQGMARAPGDVVIGAGGIAADRKSTRLNSSHSQI